MLQVCPVAGWVLRVRPAAGWVWQASPAAGWPARQAAVGLLGWQDAQVKEYWEAACQLACPAAGWGLLA